MTSGTTHIKALHYRERATVPQRKLMADRMTEKVGVTICMEGHCQSSSERGSLKWGEKAASSSS